MIFFLYGPDNYRRLKRKREIISELKKKYPDLVIGRFSLEDEGGKEDFLNFAGTRSLFGGKRVCVLEDLSLLSGKEAKELLSGFLEDKDVAIIAADQEKEPAGANFLTQAPARPEKFEELSGAELAAFVKILAKEAGLRLSPRAEKKLALAYGKDTWGLATEIGKLSSFGEEVVNDDRIEGVMAGPGSNYWPALNSLRGREVAVRLRALATFSAWKEDPAKTFNILSAAAKPQAARFAEYDINIKSGKLDYPEALLDFVLTA